jgi:hypothetical protein
VEQADAKTSWLSNDELRLVACTFSSSSNATVEYALIDTRSPQQQAMCLPAIRTFASVLPPASVWLMNACRP